MKIYILALFISLWAGCATEEDKEDDYRDYDDDVLCAAKVYEDGDSYTLYSRERGLSRAIYELREDCEYYADGGCNNIKTSNFSEFDERIYLRGEDTRIIWKCSKT